MEGITWVGAGVGMVGTHAMQCNNPGALEHKGNRKWLGMAKTQTDPYIVQFKASYWGLVALARMLGKAEKRNGQCTVAHLLSPCWKGNQTECIKFVLWANEMRPHHLLDLQHKDTMLRIMASVCRFKCDLTAKGQKLPYGALTIRKAVHFAWPQWFRTTSGAG